MNISKNDTINAVEYLNNDFFILFSFHEYQYMMKKLIDDQFRNLIVKDKIIFKKMCQNSMFDRLLSIYTSMNESNH